MCEQPKMKNLVIIKRIRAKWTNLQHCSFVNFDILGCDNGEKSFDDLKLNTFVSLRSHEAVTDGRYDSIDKEFARIRRVGNVSREVSISNELL